jgi:hypothetical protein
MRYGLALAASAGLSLAALVDISHLPRGTSNNVLPGAYMVEIDPAIIGISSITRKRSANPHVELYASMHKQGISWTTAQEYEGDLYTGASLRLSVSTYRFQSAVD